MVVFIIAVAVLVAFCFGVGGYLFFAACGRGAAVDWTDEAAVLKTPFGKHANNIRIGHQWLQAHQAEDLYMTNEEGLQLHAVWVPAENPKGTIVFAHGYHSCVLIDFSLAFELYHSRGMNILLPTHRAHGTSQGKYITFGVKESQDLLGWIHLHNARFGRYPIVCSGLSMGASTVMYLAGMTLPENVRGFVADCGFTSPKAIISHVFRQQTHLPAFPFIWATGLFARYFGGFRLSEMDSTKCLRDNQRPILLVHGLEDDFVPPEMTKQSFDACGGDKSLLLVEGATHGVSFLVARDAYLEKINQLLEKAIGGAV